MGGAAASRANAPEKKRDAKISLLHCLLHFLLSDGESLSKGPRTDRASDSCVCKGGGGGEKKRTGLRKNGGWTKCGAPRRSRAKRKNKKNTNETQLITPSPPPLSLHSTPNPASRSTPTPCTPPRQTIGSMPSARTMQAPSCRSDPASSQQRSRLARPGSPLQY